MLWLILLMGLIVAVLIYTEYRDHDCLPHKSCNQSVPKPRPDDDPLNRIDKIQKMVRNNYDYVSWRLSMLAGIIAALPIVYYLEGRIPTVFEWIIVGGLVFAATYLSSSWIWAHFFHPNGSYTEQSLIELRDQVQELVIRYSDLNGNDDSYESDSSYNNITDDLMF